MVKDERNRFDLGAFKALGGVHAVARILEDLTGATPAALVEREADASAHTFVCATAGNHGYALAAGARLFGAKARIHLSAQVSETFAERLAAKGAKVVRSGDTYEESVRAAIADAERTGAIHLADGSWPGYTEPPRRVMEGYTVIGMELADHFTSTG